ncbi:MAG: TatD family deoxyribonuclease, partial [Lysobacteraceae bacterium]
GIRGQRNEPARLPVICETIARLRGQDPQAIADATSRNARRLFNLPDAR